MPAGDSILRPPRFGERGGSNLHALIHRRSVVDQSIQDLNRRATPAFGIRDPNQKSALEDFQLGVFTAISTLAVGDSASRSAIQALKAAALQIVAEAREAEQALEKEGAAGSAAAVARAGAVGFEAAGTPRVVARAIKAQAAEEGLRIRQSAQRIAAELFRRARRIDKKRKRRRRFASFTVLRDFFEGVIQGFVRLATPIP